MSTEMSDIEARLRLDLPRLAGVLMEHADESVVPVTTVPTERGRPRRAPRGRLVAAAGVAAAIVVGAALVVASNTGSSRPTASNLARGLGAPVTLTQPSLAPRSSPVLVWTGRSVLVWGGYEGDPAAPLALRDGATLADGGTWQPTTESPWGHPGAVGTWDGARLVVLAKNGGARYDADGTKTWTDLPRLPSEDGGGFRAVAALDGRVYGLVSSGAGDTVGIAQLAATGDSWLMRATTTSGASASAFSLVPEGAGLDLWADGVRRARYEPARDIWDDSDALTVPAGFDAPRVIAMRGGVVVVDSGGSRGPALLDSATGSWRNLTHGAVTIGAGTTAVTTDDRLIVWGGEQHPGVWAWTLPPR